MTDNKREQGVLRNIDWWTVIIYIALLSFGWISVCGASYSYGETDIFSLSTRSGMQIVWIGTSIMLGMVVLLLDDRIYDTFSYVIYALLLLLLFATIFNPHSIKGSRSWLVLGPLRLQPAEFAKFATALALAKLMSTYGYNIQHGGLFCRGHPLCRRSVGFIASHGRPFLRYGAHPVVLYRYGVDLLSPQIGVAHAAVFSGCHHPLVTFAELRHQYRLHTGSTGGYHDRLSALSGAILAHP